ncbi:hypothetical protein ACVQEN_09310 [Stenotrophomonas acidaminiphila]|jgi:hypothetical protein
MNCWVRTTTPNCWKTTTTDPVASGKRKRPPCAAVSVSGIRESGGVSPVGRLADAAGGCWYDAGDRPSGSGAWPASSDVRTRCLDRPTKWQPKAAFAIGGTSVMALAGAKCLRKTFPAVRTGTSAADRNQVAPTFFFHTPGTARPPAARTRRTTSRVPVENE